MLIPLKMVTPQAESQFNEVGHAQLHRRHIRNRVAEKGPINKIIIFNIQASILDWHELPSLSLLIHKMKSKCFSTVQLKTHDVDWNMDN